MQLIHEFSTAILIDELCGLGHLSLILRIEILRVYVGVYDVLVSILNLETRCSNSAASLVQLLLFFRDSF